MKKEIMRTVRRLKAEKILQHQSKSNPKIWYTTMLWNTPEELKTFGRSSCDCPGWKNRRKCWHSSAIEK